MSCPPAKGAQDDDFIADFPVLVRPPASELVGCDARVLLSTGGGDSYREVLESPDSRRRSTDLHCMPGWVGNVGEESHQRNWFTAKAIEKNSKRNGVGYQ